MKSVKDVLAKVKGEDKVNQIVTGKGSFSRTGFSDLVNALANDTSFKIPTYDKDGKKLADINLSEYLRRDLKKTLEKANYPQRSEAAILDTCEISTAGLAEAIPYIVMEQMASGKKMDFPRQELIGNASVYLADVPSRTKTSTIRDPKTQENLGTVTTTNKPYIAVKSKSSAPSSLITKVRKDTNGKVIE